MPRLSLSANDDGQSYSRTSQNVADRLAGRPDRVDEVHLADPAPRELSLVTSGNHIANSSDMPGPLSSR